ncbi:hypothetical protein T07_8975 [Trichinella nelsoni]|uniref:Uncharacterized protein n=4 Tax=Trichinella TaxID=6333 RepID=A0A0V0ZGT7_9BILA|nr:hypothetical protein T07_8975 [Trichinella nelsoni]KRX48270.1 hypothetical protein T05_4212 [Trichinella murrelli]KRY11684.1 hypothetical protein T12_2057 [Trichinella patagoniensis]KRY29724.1 hypothetical protein T01_448 [Trichinella spiralis]
MAMTASAFQEEGIELSIKKSPGCSDLKNDPIILVSRRDFSTDRQLDGDGANDGVIHAKRPTKLEEKLFRNAIPVMKS